MGVDATETAAQQTWSPADIARAVNAVLREAGGGRMAGVRIAYEFGRRVCVVQFVRGTWLCAATVDAATGWTLVVEDHHPTGFAATLRVPKTSSALFTAISIANARA